MDDTDVDEESLVGDSFVPTVDQPPPEAIMELCRACIVHVKTALHVELDFEPETLPVLDHYLVANREQIRDRPELRELLTRTAGAYFGELVRRRVDGIWLLGDDQPRSLRICGRTAYFSFNPVGAVVECLIEDAEAARPSGELHLLPRHRRVLAERLGLLPEISTDEYYRLSTKLEVIEIAVDTCRMVEGADGDTPPEYELSDYEGDPEILGED